MKFEDKVVLITGSGTGIGMTVAKKFIENGASVIILGRRKEPLESTSEMLNKIISDKIKIKFHEGNAEASITKINQDKEL